MIHVRNTLFISNAGVEFILKVDKRISFWSILSYNVYVKLKSKAILCFHKHKKAKDEAVPVTGREGP
jgi:hypothetical protein